MGFVGRRIERETKEWFEMSLYTEHKVPDIETSMSRLFAYYLIGGHNDSRFT